MPGAFVRILASILAFSLHWRIVVSVAEHRTSRYGVHDTLARALDVESADECAKLLGDISEQLVAFREAMPHALRGEWSSVVVLVNRWHSLVDAVLESASYREPQLVRKLDDRFGILTASQVVSEEPVRYLDHLIAEVPFSPLIRLFGADVGVGLVAIDAVRWLLPGCHQLRFEASPGWPDLPEGSDTTRYRRLVELALRSMQPPLPRVRELFDLNTGEVAELFGVTRQAVEQWERNGDVPAARHEKLANLLSVGELLERKLKPGRLPLVARKRADAYGGLTMLDMVRADRDDELRELTERAFDWSVTA
jgi:transcriptional regulator with XRE-family HTH domain